MTEIKKVLVTGASGFIGRALCEKILTKGWQVRGIFRTGSDLSRLPDGVEAFLIAAIDSDTNWVDALSGIDTVVHLAARVHIMDDPSVDPLVEYRKVNVEGTRCLGIAAAKAGIKRFVYISSIKVNGEGRASAYTEDDDEAPEDPYGLSKWEAEQELHKIADKSSIEVVIIRPPLVYGPGVKANFLRLLKIVKCGIPLPLASIKNQRSFIYLENMVDAIITCINRSKAAGHTFLVSDGKNISTPELIKQIAMAMGKPALLFSIPPFLIQLAGKFTGKSSAIDRLLDSFTIDSSRIRKELEWNPPYTMKEGIEVTVHGCGSQLTVSKYRNPC